MFSCLDYFTRRLRRTNYNYSCRDAPVAKGAFTPRVDATRRPIAFARYNHKCPLIIKYVKKRDLYPVCNKRINLGYMWVKNKLTGNRCGRKST